MRTCVVDKEGGCNQSTQPVILGMRCFPFRFYFLFFFIRAEQDGKIEEQELVDYLMKVQVERVNKHHVSLKDRATEIFKRADRDGNGVLSKKELKRVLHEDDDLRDELRTAHGRHWKEFWGELDANDVSLAVCVLCAVCE